MRPSANNFLNHRISLRADELHHIGTGQGPQGLDLLAHGAGNARQVQRSAAVQKGGIKAGRMHKKPGRATRAGMPMTHVLPNRQDRFLPIEGLADNA